MGTTFCFLSSFLSLCGYFLLPKNRIIQPPIDRIVMKNKWNDVDSWPTIVTLTNTNFFPYYLVSQKASFLKWMDVFLNKWKFCKRGMGSKVRARLWKIMTARENCSDPLCGPCHGHGKWRCSGLSACDLGQVSPMGKALQEHLQIEYVFPGTGNCACWQ